MLYYNHKARAKEIKMTGLEEFYKMLKETEKSKRKHWTKGDISARQQKKNYKRGAMIEELEETLIKTSEKEYETYIKKRLRNEFRNFVEMKKYLKQAINKARSTK